MKLRSTYLTLFAAIFLWQCHGNTNVSEVGDGIFYSISFRSNNARFLLKSATCEADSNGHLLVHLTLSNSGEYEIQCSLSEWELETVDGLRSSPVKTDSVIFIKPGESSIDLEFQPTNSLALYRLTSLKGDLGKHYKLTYRQNLIEADLLLSNDRHEIYKKKWGVEKSIVVYKPKQDSIFEQDEEIYLTRAIQLKNDDEKLNHSVHATDQDFLIDGLNARFSVYQIKDTLTINVALVNHSPFVVTIELNSTEIQFDASTVKPLLSNESSYKEIPRSEREFITLKYFYPEMKTDKFNLDVSSIKFQIPNPISVFRHKTIVFVKSEIPSVNY